MKKILVSAVLLCAFFSCEILAAPTLNGPTGLITLPNADVVDFQDYNLGLGASALKDIIIVNTSANFSPLNKLELGLAKPFSKNETPLYFNAKYKLWNYGRQQPFSLALGAQIGFFRESELAIYAMTTHPTPYPLIPSIGARIASAGGKTYFEIPIGAEWLLTDNFRLLPEITISKFFHAGLGGRLAVNKNMRLDLFWLSTDNQSRIGFQVSFNSHPKIWFW